MAKHPLLNLSLLHPTSLVCIVFIYIYFLTTYNLPHHWRIWLAPIKQTLTAYGSPRKWALWTLFSLMVECWWSMASLLQELYLQRKPNSDYGVQPLTSATPQLTSASKAHVWQLLSHRNKPTATPSLWSMAGFMLGMQSGKHGKCVVTDINTCSARECSNCAWILSTSTSASASYKHFTVFPGGGAGSPSRLHAFPHFCVICGYSPQFLMPKCLQSS